MFDTYAEIFAERAGSYHGAMERSPRARAAEFAAVLEPLGERASGTLCDMPSGGCYLADFLPPSLTYIGVEPVESFGAFASEGRSTVSSPITDVPLPGGSIDYVISLAGLHHEPALQPVFAEMRRLLRPGGRVVVADVSAGTGPARFLNGFVAEHNPLGHDGRFLDEQTASSMASAGFEVVEDEVIAVPWQFGSADELADFCAGLFGVEGVSGDEVLDALARDIGVKRSESYAQLDWRLRRIVCDAA